MAVREVRVKLKLTNKQMEHRNVKVEVVIKQWVNGGRPKSDALSDF